jgi:hypothetical protein
LAEAPHRRPAWPRTLGGHEAPHRRLWRSCLHRGYHLSSAAPGRHGPPGSGCAGWAEPGLRSSATLQGL